MQFRKNPTSLDWIRDKLRVDFPVDSDGLRDDATSPVIRYLIMAAYKNLSSLLFPNNVFYSNTIGTNLVAASIRRKSLPPKTSIELISPVVQITFHEGYYLAPSSYIKIHFNLTEEQKSLFAENSFVEGEKQQEPQLIFPQTDKNHTTNISTLWKMKGTYFVCGVLDNSSSATDVGKLRWTLIMNTCNINIHIKGSYVECQCKSMGMYGLLKISNLEDVSEIKTQ